MRTRLLTAVAIAAVAFSGVAQASVITETFTGFINSGSDSVGAFGAAGANLAGDAVTFSFSYDAGLLQADVTAGTDGSNIFINSTQEQYTDLAGDSAITDSVTINSQTLTIASIPLGFVVGCTAAACVGDGEIIVVAQNGAGEFIQTLVPTTQNYLVGDDLLSQTEVDALVGGGVTTALVVINDGVAGVDDLTISAQSSATPEPATWISLALGFGMVGMFKRRRGAR